MAVSENYLNLDKDVLGDLSNINDNNVILLVCDDKDKPYAAIDRIVSGYDKFIKLKKEDKHLTVSTPISYSDGKLAIENVTIKTIPQ